jgi:hypothetical protein
MNSAGKPHRNANISVRSVLRRSPVFRISKPFLSKFITASSSEVRAGVNALKSSPARKWQARGRIEHTLLDEGRGSPLQPT